MTDQMNSNETSETQKSREVAVGEDGTPGFKKKVWLWLLMCCVVPIALIGLGKKVALVIWVLLGRA
ncbi:MAG: hypothetical protein CMM01_20040 [Rhodopirellula sp.]|nr:hypothetical protein [Rhodopirellula sp.]